MTMRIRLLPFQMKSSKAVLIPSFTERRKGSGEDFMTAATDGLVKSFLLEKKMNNA